MPDVWRRVLKGLKWPGIAFLGLLGLACSLFAVTYFINAHDEKLAPQTLALLAAPPNPYRAEDNIYLALEGLDAPSGKSVIVVGQARIARYNQNLEGVLRDPSPARLASLRTHDQQRLEFRGDVSFLHPLDGSVWSEAAQHQAQIERLLADNAELYGRYLALLGLPGYYETARPSEFAPLPSPPTAVRKLFLAAIALHLRSVFAHEREVALADLESDVRLWRAVLTAKGALLGKMLAVAYLQSDYLLLADLITDGHVALPRDAADGDSLAPVFDLQDWDIGSAFAAEFRTTVAALGHTDDAAAGTLADGQARDGMRGWLNRTESHLAAHFYKLNATENLIARRTARQMLAAADPGKVPRTAPGAGTWLPQDQSMWSLPFAYNPIGKALATVLAPGYDNYSLRAWDAAALQRLVRAGYEVRRARLGAGAVPAFLEGHPQWSTHPKDGRPFLWNAATGELRVQTLAQHPAGRRFGIHVLAPPAAPR